MDKLNRDSVESNVFFKKREKNQDTSDFAPHTSSKHVLVTRQQKQANVKSGQEIGFHPHLPVVHTLFKPSAISRTISVCWTYERHGRPIQGIIWKNNDAERREIAGGDEELRERLRSSPHFEYFRISSEGSKIYTIKRATQVSLSQVLRTHLIKLGTSYQSEWIVDIVGQLLSVLRHLHHHNIQHGSLNTKTVEFTGAGQMNIVQFASYHVGGDNVDWRSVREILNECMQQVLSNLDSSNFRTEMSKAASLEDFLYLEHHKFLSQMPMKPSGQLQQLIRLTPWHVDQKYPVPAL